MILKVLLIIMLVIILFMNIRYKESYQQFIKTYHDDITLPIIAPFAFSLIDKLNLYKLSPKLVNSIHQKIILLKGSKLARDYTKIYLAKIITVFTLAVFFTIALTVTSGNDYSNIIYGLLLTGIICFYLIKDLDKKVRERKDAIIIELPEFVNKIILLVNAGDTVQGAIMKSVKQNQKKIHESPLYYELNEVVNKMTTNTPFQEVLKDFSYRCGIQEVSIFTTTVMMNYRKGGSLLVNSLKELSTTLWDKRKTVTRIKGEEASSKLIFPIIFIFISVLLIVVYPAIAIF